MSGLRETIRRRGGLELTSRVVGGLWVVGQRTKTSPYNAAATAALMAAFPTQWPTIRDYGWQHPALVPFINEDPMLVMSLIDGLGVRYLITQGPAYTTSSITPDQTTKVVVRAKVPSIASEASWLYASRISYGSRGYSISTQKTQLYFDFANAYSFVSATMNTDEHTYMIEDGKVYYDNMTTPIKTFTVSSFTCPAPAHIFALYQNGSVGTNGEAWIRDIEEWHHDIHTRLVPFISQTQGAGLLDVINFEFHENKGSGAFSTSS